MMEDIKILYIFDKYLNRTMNWAHRIIKYTSDIRPLIASPLIVHNEFYEEEWEFIFSPFQWEKVEDEWSFSFIQTKIASGTVKIPFLYKSFLERKIKETKPDVIHVHFGNKAWEYSALAEKLNIPLIATFHGYDYHMVLKNKPVFWKRYKDLFKRATFVTVGGTLAKEYLKSIGCPAEKICLVPMAIETDNVIPSTKIKEKGELNLLQISSFKEKKGQIYTLKAFAAARKKNRKLQLTFIGEFVDKGIVNEIKSYIVKNNLTKTVTILDSIPYSELMQKIREFDVFIHPSVTGIDGDTECTPVSIMDAQCTGLPVISTHHADIPDLVLHKKTGILTEEKDIEGLTNAILLFADKDEETMNIWRNAAKKHICENYEIKDVSKMWANLYQRAQKNI